MVDVASIARVLHACDDSQIISSVDGLTGKYLS